MATQPDNNHDYENPETDTALMKACRDGKTDLARRLIKEGVDVNATRIR